MQPNNLQSFIANNDAQAATQPQSSGGNFFTHLLPTAGSILGGIGGALIPGLGETGVGEVGGASAGSAAGKALENLLEGHQSSLGDLAGAATEGGVGQLTGMGAGKLLGGVLGKLATVGDTGSAATAAAEKLSQDFGGVPKPIRDRLNMNSNAQKFASYGLPYDTETINAVAPIVTGGVDSEPGLAILHKGTVRAMQGAGPVDVTGAQALAQQIAKSPDIAAAGPSVGKAFANDVSERLGQTMLPVDIHSGSVPNLMNSHAPSVFEVQQALEEAGHSTKNPALSKAYLDVADSLDSALQRAGANDVVAKGLYSPAEIDQLAKISPQLAAEAQTVQSVGQNRSLQAPFVQSANLAKAAGRAAEGALPSTQQGPGLLGQLATGATQFATGGPAAKVGVLTSLGKVGAPVLKQLASLGETISKAGGAASLPKTAAQVVAHGPEYVNNPVGVSDLMQPSQASQTGAAPAEAGGQSQLNAVNLAQHLLDIMNANPNQTQTVAPLLAQLIPQVQKTNIAQQALQGYQQTLGAAGGPQGPIGGGLAQLGGVFTGGPAAQVGPERLQAAAAIANATGMNLNEALAALPSLLSSTAGANQGFGQAGSVLGALR